MKNLKNIIAIFTTIIFMFAAFPLFTSCVKQEQAPPVKTGEFKQKVGAEKAPAPEAKPVTIPQFLNVYFGFNKYGPKKESVPVISDVAKWMKENPQFKVKIDGYTDTQGPSSYNQGLSELRANYVKKLLVNNGVQDNRIITEGHGEENPVSKKHPENRRVEFKILKVEVQQK